MKLIGDGDKVLAYFSGNRSIISGQLIKISTYLITEKLVVDLDIRLLHSKMISLYQLRFVDVKEYLFYHHSDYYFYNIENCKFLKTGNLYYLSLDPYDEKGEISKKDMDFILSESVEAYSILSDD